MQSFIIATEPTDLTSEGSGDTASIIVVKSETIAQTTTASKSTTHVGPLACRFDKAAQAI